MNSKDFDTVITGTGTAADICAIDELGSGSINGSDLTSISGSSYDAILSAKLCLSPDPKNFTIELTAGKYTKANIVNLNTINGTGTFTFSGTAVICDTASNVKDVINGSYITSDTSFNSELTGIATATDITAIETDNGTGTIDGSALTEINGTCAEITQALADLDTDPTNFNSTLSAGAENATDITALEAANGTGTISGSNLTAINGTAAAVVQAIADLDSDPTNFNSTLTGVAAAADITAIEAANGTGKINGSALTEINGTAAAVVQAYGELDEVAGDNGFTKPANFNSTLTGVAAAADITAIEAANGNGTITGTALTQINGTAAAVVQAIADLDSDPTNFNSTLTGVAAATAITAIETANGTGTITGTALTAINGTYAQIAQALTDLDTDPTNFDSTLSEGAEDATDITALEAANGTGTINGSALTQIDGTAAAVVQAIADLDTDPTNFNSTLSAGAANAADITAIEAANGTGTINGSALTAINGTAAAVVQAIADLDTDPTNFNSTLTGAAAAADITAIEAANGNGTINGQALTAINGTYAEITQALADLDAVENQFTKPVNFNSTLSAGAAAAADITALEAANGNGTIDGSALTAINGTAAAVVQAIADLDTDPTNFNSTLTGAATATDITAIEAANGTGTITGSALTAINGTYAEIVQALTDLDADPTNFNSTLSAGTAAAADITALEAANGTGTIDGSNLTAINGTAAAVVQAIADLDTDPTNFNTTLSAGTAAAADITAIEAANGTGTINGAALTAINGTAAAVVQAIADLDTDPTNFNSTLTGVAAAADITAIEAANGTGTITGSALIGIDGTYAEIVQALLDLDADPTNFNSTLSAGAAAAADITALEAANGTGTIDGSALTAITGTAGAVVQAITDLDTDPTNFNSTLTGAADATDITAIEAANGNGTINGQALTAINGTYAEITQALADLDAVENQFTKPVNFNSTLSEGAEDAANITMIEGVNGTGTINGSALTAINGTAAAVVQAIADLDTDPTNFNSTLTGAADATDITAIETANGNNGTIDGSALTAINGTYAEIAKALTDLDADPTNFNSTLSAGAEDATDITALEAANGTGTIDGSALTAINGTAAAVVQAIADLDTDPTNFNTTLSAGAVNATDITAIEAANGTGTINGSALTAINGTAAAVVQAIADLDTDPTNFNSTLTGAATATDITAIEAANGTGTITGTALTAINGTYAEIAQALTDLDADPTNFNSTLSAGAENATDITALEAANGTGTIDGSALTDINGTYAEIVQAIADLDTDPTNFDSTLTGVATAADIAAIRSS